MRNFISFLNGLQSRRITCHRKLRSGLWCVSGARRRRCLALELHFVPVKDELLFIQFKLLPKVRIGPHLRPQAYNKLVRVQQGHAVSEHQIADDDRGRSRYAACAINYYFASWFQAVVNEMKRAVKVESNIISLGVLGRDVQ